MKAELEEHIEMMKYDEEHDRLFAVLISDLHACRDQLESRPTQCHRRSLARAIFALVDGQLFMLKQHVLKFSKYDGWTLDEEDEELLSEQRKPQNNGKIAPRFLPTIRNLEYAIDSYSLLSWAKYKLDKTTRGWEAFIRAMAIRNRITHPKNWRSLDITDSELEHLYSATEWFLDTISDLYMKCYRARTQRSRLLVKAWEKEHGPLKPKLAKQMELILKWR